MSSKEYRIDAIVSLFLLAYILLMIVLWVWALVSLKHTFDVQSEIADTAFSLAFSLITCALGLLAPPLLTIIAAFGAFSLTESYIATIVMPLPLLALSIISIKERCHMIDALDAVHKALIKSR